MLTVGQMVGNYRVLREIGRGGMGAVFEAEHQYIGRRAAIKALFPELSQHPQIINRFQNEARAVALVRHPGIVEVFEFGLLPEGPAFIIMELLEGESLGTRMERLAGSWSGAELRIFQQVALALQAAHDKGIIHRDLKPENVMIVDDPERPGRKRAKLLDFGIAKIAAEAAAGRHRTETGMTLGTPEYMSPEQCIGTPLSGKVDVYALGIMLYELLAGRLPFDSELAAEIMVQQVRQTPPPLEAVEPALPPMLAAMVHTMLEKSPDDRPSMGEVAGLLEGFLDVSGIAPAPPPKEERTPALRTKHEWPKAPPKAEAAQEEAAAKERAAEASPRPQPPTVFLATTPEAPPEAPPRRQGVRGSTWLAFCLGSAVTVGLLVAVSTAKRRGDGASGPVPPPPTLSAVPASAAPGAAAVVPAPAAVVPAPAAVVPAPAAVVPAPAPTPAPQAPALVRCLVTSTPDHAAVVGADGKVLGQTPWRPEGPAGGPPLSVVLRREGHADQRVTLEWAEGCRKEVTLLSAPRAAAPKPAAPKPAAAKPPAAKRNDENSPPPAIEIEPLRF